MANKTIGDGQVERRTISINRKDWNSLQAMASKGLYNLNGVTSVIRLLLRTWQKFERRNLLDLALELEAEGYEATLHGLLNKVRDENDRIYPTDKEEIVLNKDYGKMIMSAFQTEDK